MDDFRQLPIAARTLWAKSGDECAHGLLAHMLDVAAVAVIVLAQEPPAVRARIASSFGVAQDAVITWVALLVGLHDFGKGIPGFQGKWANGRTADEEAGLPFSAISMGVERHDLASAALLRDLLVDRGISALWVAGVLRALGAHHGYMPTTEEINSARPRFEATEWRQARGTIFDAYWSVLAPRGAPPERAIDLPTTTWLAGLTSLCDWIGSNQDWFAPGERDTSIRGHFERAQALARSALREIGWPAFRPLLEGDDSTDALVGKVIGHFDNAKARPLQAAADRLLVGIDEPALMIVEAPMGEGKTELAFVAHLRLQNALGHRGLYVALPTQATGNAVFDRALTFLRAFSGDAHLDIQLVHGGTMFDERVYKLRGVNASREDSVSSSAWFSQRRRGLLSPYGIGTIDQALFATLNVKHHFVRLWGLANRVVVLDEVHAYDTYTSVLIEALLRWLRAMGCSVVLMSATLPAKRRDALLAAWGIDSARSQDTPYPRITLATSARIVSETFACRALAPIHVAAIAEDLDSIAQCTLAATAAGGCGAVIVNTVQRAQDLYVRLKSCVGADTELMLFHARYPADERGARERAVLDRFGKDVPRPRSALLIATQVVEQSLDIDFDFLVTDLAPVDLLLQRAGRLHRHERHRPTAHRTPVLTVAGLIADRLPELHETKWKYVYDAYVLYRTWLLVVHEPIWNLPTDIDRLVQDVYGDISLPDDLADEVRKRIDDAWGESLATHQQQNRQAINAAIDATDAPQNAYLLKPRGSEEGDGLGIQNKTRLGDDGVTVVPIHQSHDGWRLHPDDPPFDPKLIPDDVLAQRLYRRQVRITRKDVVVGLAAATEPGGLAEHPLLRHMKWLLLTDGHVRFDTLEVGLDAELGITYQSDLAGKEIE